MRRNKKVGKTPQRSAFQQEIDELYIKQFTGLVIKPEQQMSIKELTESFRGKDGSLIKGNTEIILDPIWQRLETYPEDKYRRIITTLYVEGMPIPTLYFWETKKDGKTVRYVVDGKQRLISILRFWGVPTQYNPAPKTLTSVPGISEGGGYTDLSPDQQEDFLKLTVPVKILTGPIEAMKAYLKVLNEAKSFNKNEYRRLLFSDKKAFADIFDFLDTKKRAAETLFFGHNSNKPKESERRKEALQKKINSCHAEGDIAAYLMVRHSTKISFFARIADDIDAWFKTDPEVNVYEDLLRIIETQEILFPNELPHKHDNHLIIFIGMCSKADPSLLRKNRQRVLDSYLKFREETKGEEKRKADRALEYIKDWSGILHLKYEDT
jgi:hypothetical protein